MEVKPEKFIPKKQVSLDFVKKIEIDILRTFVDFCEQHQLRYYLVGGTLIGAVRHQGFVPWDDDMDVAMPRKDFMKFRELTTDGKIGKYEIRSYIHTPDLHFRPFDRIVDPHYMTKVKVEQVFIPPWLDVHALDGLPTDLEENKKHWVAVRKLKFGSMIARTPLCLTKNRIRRLAKRIYYIKYYMRGAKYYAEKLTELALQYDYDESEYIAAFVAGYGQKERMPRYYFEDGKQKMWFEGILCSVPAHYDLVLRHMYGDNYLTLPQKRVVHMVEAWEIKSSANEVEQEKKGR